MPRRRGENGRLLRKEIQCVCDCGNEKIVTIDNLRKGATRSCGCLKNEDKITHGHTRGGHSCTFRAWTHMRDRCLNPSCTDYKHYGGRGLAVCERWNSFKNFLMDLGERPPGTTLGRIDNGKGYHPGNVRWETPKQQGRNKRNNRIVSVLGKTGPMSAVCDELSLDYKMVKSRLHKGWSVEDAFTAPKRRHENGCYYRNG
jgi:hypothetical protein